MGSHNLLLFKNEITPQTLQPGSPATDTSTNVISIPGIAIMHAHSYIMYAHTYSHFTGKPYGKVSKWQKQRKLAKIKAKTTQYLRGLQKAGLIATCLQLQSVEGENIDVQLVDKIVRPPQPTIRTCSQKNKSLVYTLMKNNISLAVYHELSMIFQDLPRSYQVASYS